MRFLVSEADVLEEQELHDGCTRDVLIYMPDKKKVREELRHINDEFGIVQWR
jgi:hypothetical protein